MRFGIAAAVVVAGLAAPAVASAGEIHVPGAHRRLGDAIEAAQPGDTIVLDGGVHRGPFVVAVDDLTIQGNGGRIVQGRRALRSRSLADDPVLDIRADRVTLTGLDIHRGGVRIEGDGALLEYCRIVRADDRRHAAIGILVFGSGATIRNCTISGGRGGLHGVQAIGSRVTVSGNYLDGVRDGGGIGIHGDEARVSGNTLSDLDGREAIEVDGDLAVIEDNSLDIVEASEGGILVEGDGAVVTRNSIESGELLGPSVFLEGSDGLVSENDAVAGEATGIVVRGHRNRILNNGIAGDNDWDSRQIFGHGLVVRGSDNLIRGNDLWGIPADAVRLVGGARNTVDDTSAWAAGACGLLNVCSDTAVTGCSFNSSATDIVNAGSFTLFDGNEFTTGSTDTTDFGGPTDFDDDLGIADQFMPAVGSRD